MNHMPDEGIDMKLFGRTAFKLGHRKLAKAVSSFMEHRCFLTIMLIALIAGALLARDYGQSWDEWTNYRYGEIYLKAYYDPESIDQAAIDYYHAPFYFMLWAALSKFIQSFLPWLQASGARHLTNYLCFLMGLIAFYSLALKLFEERIARVAAVLFGLQPFLFGHAFINQKDIPFMAFFTLSVAIGIRAADFAAGQSQALRPESPILKEILGGLREDWRNASKGRRLGLLGMLTLAVLLTLDMAYRFLIFPIAENLVRYLYQDPSTPLLGPLFRLVAEDYHKTPLAAYLMKLDRAYFWAKYLLAAGSWLAFGLKFMRFFGDAWSPDRLKKAAGLGLWLMAGIVLGMTTSIRIVGLFAGALVGIYALTRIREKSLPALAAYGSISLLTTYVTWPALWGDPLVRFLSRISTTIRFGPHPVLYEGQITLSKNLPWHYAPKILAIKITEPALILIAIGVGLSLLPRLRRAHSAQLLAILALWFLVPIASACLDLLTLYGDRQLFFALPPLFLFAGVGLSGLFRVVRRQWIKSVILVGLVLPGLVGIIKLHPYQYIYYNGLVGGVRGAEGRYQLDYWCTSYRQAVEYLNEVAPSGAKIMAWGPYDAADEFAREDLKVFPLSSYDADYILGCSRALRNPDFFSEGEVAYEVVVDGAVLAVVKTPPGTR